MVAFNITIKQTPGIPKISAVSILPKLSGMRIPIFSLNVFRSKSAVMLRAIDPIDFINGCGSLKILNIK